MRLTWSNKVYWSSVERSCVRNRVLIETWDEMKDKQEKYFPESNSHRLLDELHRLRQGSMSVQIYTTFDDLTLCCELQEDHHQTIFRFRSGLKTDIQWAMIIHSQTIKTLAQAS